MLSTPVACIEAWYVDEDLRGGGVGAALVRAAEAWARGLGLREIASDAVLGNEPSIAAHRALDYDEVERNRVLSQVARRRQRDRGIEIVREAMLNIAVLGTGIVGSTLGRKLVEAGHSVMMGSRERDNPRATAWASTAVGKALHGTFADAARHGEVILNCTAGTAALHALELAGAENLGTKILIDVSNPLDFSRAMPPSLTVCNTGSLGEQIQRAFPSARVVKTLNTVTCAVMAGPGPRSGRSQPVSERQRSGSESAGCRLAGRLVRVEAGEPHRSRRHHHRARNRDDAPRLGTSLGGIGYRDLQLARGRGRSTLEPNPTAAMTTTPPSPAVMAIEQRMPRTMLRYAIEKYPEGVRQQYLRGEIRVPGENRS